MLSHYKHFSPYASTVACTGNNGCPICKTFSEMSRPKKKFIVNVIDKSDGTMKTMSLSESAYKQIVGKVKRMSRLQRIKNWFSDLMFEIKHWRYHVYRLGQWIKETVHGLS